MIFVILTIAVLVGVEARSHRRAKTTEWKGLAAELAANDRWTAVLALAAIWTLALV